MTTDTEDRDIKVTTTVMLSPEAMEWLRQQAKERECSVGYIIRLCIKAGRERGYV